MKASRDTAFDYRIDEDDSYESGDSEGDNEIVDDFTVRSTRK